MVVRVNDPLTEDPWLAANALRRRLAEQDAELERLRTEHRAIAGYLQVELARLRDKRDMTAREYEEQTAELERLQARIIALEAEIEGSKG